MKNTLLTFVTALALLTGCSKNDGTSTETGTLSLSYIVSTGVNLKASVDPSTFKLAILNSKGSEVKTFAQVSDVPEQIELIMGEYTVNTYSQEFSAPAFDTPVYGGEEVVSIVAGKEKAATINCVQTNAGIKFEWTDEFKAAFSEYAAEITSAEGTIAFTSMEARSAYFKPGEVTVKITVGSGDNAAVFTKTLTVNGRELITVKPTPVEVGSGSLSLTITVNTDVTERIEVIEISSGDTGGGDTGGGDTGGGDTGNGTALLEEDFASATAGTDFANMGTQWPGNANFPTVLKTYEANGLVKLGSSSTGGSIESKELDLSVNGGVFKVQFKVKGWKSDDTEIIVEATGLAAQTLTYATTGKEGELVTVEASFTGGQANSKVTIKTADTKRAFVDDVRVVN